MDPLKWEEIRPDHLQCLKCDYVLHGVLEKTVRCPECGATEEAATLLEKLRRRAAKSVTEMTVLTMQAGVAMVLAATGAVSREVVRRWGDVEHHGAEVMVIGVALGCAVIWALMWRWIARRAGWRVALPAVVTVHAIIWLLLVALLLALLNLITLIGLPVRRMPAGNVERWWSMPLVMINMVACGAFAVAREAAMQCVFRLRLEVDARRPSGR